uniref:C-type lectin domain-containing protein n=1 Tax=Gasterosteus aculeatus aculeatus TaxID=481459 RepID=A0AAQ4RPR5_GASAC
SLASAELAEQITNLTSANQRLARERERLHREASGREAAERNASRNARRLADSEEEGRHGLIHNSITLLRGNKRSCWLHKDLVSSSTERICRKCLDGWRLFENKCYFFSSQTLTWSSSRSWCRTQGGDLLVVDSQPEQVEDNLSGRRLWIGLSDREEEGEWRWVDGSRVLSDVQFWLSRPGLGPEPDDWKLDDPRGEDCGLLDASEQALGSWMDGSCEESYRWICEKNV